LAHGQLVAPGAVTTYSGTGSQRRSYGTVRDPAMGFFVAGSSLAELNGVYVRSQPTAFPGFKAGPSQHRFLLNYHNDMSGWHMALVEPADGAAHSAHGGQGSEWVFISPPDHQSHGWRDRFGHEGATVIPGSGMSWQHLHRAHVSGPDSPLPSGLEEDEARVSSAGGGGRDATDELDELPFQVIYIGDQAMLHRLRNGIRYHQRNVRNALEGASLPMLPPVANGSPDGSLGQVRCPAVADGTPRRSRALGGGGCL
jgi:hypothetical protein